MIGFEPPGAEILLLPLLSLALGIELYLTLLLLSVSSVVGWLAAPPWVLTSTGSPIALATTAALYGLELACETRATSALSWHAVQAVARPLAGALVGASLLGSHGVAAGAAGAVGGAGIAWLAHAAKRGADARRWLSGGKRVAPYLISALEDTVVLGLVVLALERPTVGGGIGLLGALVLLVVRRPLLPSAHLALRLVWDRASSLLSERGWQRGRQLPRAVREAWKRSGRDEPEALRGIPAGALELPGRAGLASGWLLATGRRVSFAVTGTGDVELVELEAPRRIDVERRALSDRIHLGGDEEEASPTTLILSKRSPPVAAVVAELRELAPAVG